MPSASLLHFQLGDSDFPAAEAEGTVDGVEARLIGRQELDDAAGAAEQRATSSQQCCNAAMDSAVPCNAGCSPGRSLLGSLAVVRVWRSWVSGGGGMVRE